MEAEATLPATPRWTAPTIVAAGAVIAAIAVLAALSPKWLIYDEIAYMEGPYLLAQRFDFETLMVTRLDMSAGPLYAYLHWLASPLTQLTPPAIRFVNLAALLVSLWAISVALSKLGHADGSARAALFLAVPMLGPTSGLALTELPALMFACLATVCVATAWSRPIGRRLIPLWLAAGLCAGLAILGRQTYLPGLLGFVMIAWADRRHVLPAMLCLAAAGLTVAPLLIVWGGLAPPWQAAIISGVVVEHGVLAFVYLATAILLIAPRYIAEPFGSRPMQAAGLAAVLAAPMIAWFGSLRFEVAYRVVAVFPPAWEPSIQAAITGAMLSIAALYGLATAYHLWHRRGEHRVMLLLGLTILLNGTAVGIAHQFSSRYVLVAFPFALLGLQPWIRPGLWAAARILIGGVLGLASLSAYYWNEPAPDPDWKSIAPQEILRQMPLRFVPGPAT